jgi:hypothetical protein
MRGTFMFYSCNFYCCNFIVNDTVILILILILILCAILTQLDIIIYIYWTNVNINIYDDNHIRSKRVCQEWIKFVLKIVRLLLVIPTSWRLWKQFQPFEAVYHV